MPGSRSDRPARRGAALRGDASWRSFGYRHSDRKSTRLNSSHLVISYAVFCLKKKNVVDRKSTRLNSSHLVISYAVFCLKKKKPVKLTTRLLKGSSVIRTNYNCQLSRRHRSAV